MSVKAELPTYGYRCTPRRSSCHLASRVLVLASAILADVSSDDQWSRWIRKSHGRIVVHTLVSNKAIGQKISG